MGSKDVLAVLGQFEFDLAQTSEHSELSGINSYQQFCESIESVNEFWLYLSPISDRSFFYFEKAAKGSKKISYRKFFQIQDVPDIEHLQAFEQGTLGLKKSGLCLTLDQLEINPNVGNRTIIINVSLVGSNMPVLSHPSDFVTKVSPLLKLTQEHFMAQNIRENEYNNPDDSFPIVQEENNLAVSSKPDVDDLYETIKDLHHDKRDLELCNPAILINPQHKSLLPKLRPYQVNAVRWMVFREKQESFSETLHPLYQEIKLFSKGHSDLITLYYNRAGGYFIQEKPYSNPCPPGGILADEMGLGKTVEILSLMLTHPRQEMNPVVWKKPIKVASKSMRKVKRRRLRSPSPTEFKITEKEYIDIDTCSEDSDRNGTDVNDEIEDRIMQVDG